MAGKYATRLSAIGERLQRAVNVKYLPHPEGGNFVRIPGFRYGDFNRAGFVKITAVNRMMEMVRLNSHPVSASWGSVFFVMLGRSFNFYPTLFDRAAVEFPMILRSSVSKVGQSSIDFFQTLEDEKANSVLASVSFRLVNIDPVVRGSAVPLPENFRDQMRAILTPGTESFQRVSPPRGLPTEFFSCRVRVRYDDMDSLFHTNQGSYLEFALECASQAAESGFYSRIREDVGFRRARRAVGVHLAESHAGDELEVFTWEDEIDKLLVNFAVRKGEDVIYYAQVEYLED